LGIKIKSALLKGAVQNSSAQERELFDQLSSFKKSCSKSSAPIKRTFEQLIRSAQLNL
jgi:hypothetical protein